MVPVLVGDQDCCKIARFHAAGGETQGQLPGAQSRIDEKARRFGSYQCGVSVAAAGQNRDLKHRKSLRPRRKSREIFSCDNAE
jgi:hypothetical protein